MPNTGWVCYLIHLFYHLSHVILPKKFVKRILSLNFKGSSRLLMHYIRADPGLKTTWLTPRATFSWLNMMPPQASQRRTCLIWDLKAKKGTSTFPSRPSRDGEGRGRSFSRWREQHVQTWRDVKMLNVFRDWLEVQNSCIWVLYWRERQRRQGSDFKETCMPCKGTL